MIIIWKPKVLLYGWHDVEQYEALRQKLLAARATPARQQKRAGLNPNSVLMDLLRYLDRYEREHGQMPSYMEIAQQFQLKSPGNARYWVVALEDVGLVKIGLHEIRGIRLTAKGREVLEAERMALV